MPKTAGRDTASERDKLPARLKTAEENLHKYRARQAAKGSGGLSLEGEAMSLLTLNAMADALAAARNPPEAPGEQGRGPW